MHLLDLIHSHVSDGKVEGASALTSQTKGLKRRANTGTITFENVVVQYAVKLLLNLTIVIMLTALNLPTLPHVVTFLTLRNPTRGWAHQCWITCPASCPPPP
jgi:hypothetical protein